MPLHVPIIVMINRAIPYHMLILAALNEVYCSFLTTKNIRYHNYDSNEEHLSTSRL